MNKQNKSQEQLEVQEQLQKVCQPVSDFIREHYDLMCIVQVNAGGATVYSAELDTTIDFLD